jgi:hypothetical protein
LRTAHILVEGQTEGTFVRDVLAPHLHTFGVYLNPVVALTKRVKSGLKFKGGVPGYVKLRGELCRLLNDTSAVAVTTMMDYYGLPGDYPGADSIPRRGSCYDRVAHLEKALQEDLQNPRFLPYLSLHEFEALLFVAPELIETTVEDHGVADRLAALAASPEEVNDGPDTHPAARLLAAVPKYRKALHGPLIVGRIGLPAIRQRCPHLHTWISRLEQLGAG